MKKELKNKEVCAQKPLPFAFHPKATNYITGRSSGSSGSGCLPIPINRNSGESVPKHYNGLTATGIAPDLNRVPF
jgi:hypothetical protein